ncbi:MAG TPA: WD40 repeat domain-containing protein, partial [Kofleriaceae bacterium]
RLIAWKLDGGFEAIEPSTGARWPIETPIRQDPQAVVVRDGQIFAARYPNTVIDGTGHVWESGHPGSPEFIAPLGGALIATAQGHTEITMGANEHNANDNDITISDGTVIARLVGHASPISSLAVHGSLLISADTRGEARVWYRTPVETRAQGVPIALGFIMRDRKTLVEHVPNGAVMAVELETGAAREITEPGREYDPEQAQFGRSGIPDASAMQLRVARNGARWTTLDHVGRAWVWDLATGGYQICDDCDEAHDIAISADGNRVAMATERAVWLRDAVAKRETHFDTLTMDDGADQLALTTHGTELAYTSKDGVLHSGPFGQASIVKPRVFSKTLEWTDDDKQLVTVDEGTVTFVDVATKRETGKKLVGHSADVTYLGRDSTGRYVTLSLDKTARIWNDDGSAIVLQAPTAMSSIEVVGDRAITIEKHAVRLWDLATRTNRQLPAIAPAIAGFAANGDLVVVEKTGRFSRYTDALSGSEAVLRTWMSALTGG